MRFTIKQIWIITLTSLTNMLLYANIYAAITVLPQYFRDANIYSYTILPSYDTIPNHILSAYNESSNDTWVPYAFRKYKNEKVLNAFLFCLFPIGEIIFQPVSAIVTNR